MENSIRNDNTNFAKLLLLEFFAVSLLLLARIYKLEQTGVFDYDSAKNLIIIKEICVGNFQNLFHHASPSFYLFLAPFYKLSESFLWLEFICAILSAISIPLFGRLFQTHFKLNLLEYALLLFFVGTTTFLVVSARNLAIENLSLPIFALLLHVYTSKRIAVPVKFSNLTDFESSDSKKLKESFFKKLFNWFKHPSFNQKHHKQSLFSCKTEWRKWKLICFWSALLFTINYKIIPFFLILLFVETLKTRTFEFKKWLLLGSSILAFVGLYSFLSWILGIDSLLYLKNIYAQAFVKDMNPAKELSNFNWDIFFYFKYIRDFENPVLWLGWAGLIYFGRKEVVGFFNEIISESKKPTFSRIEILAIVAICFVCGMSILVKAPRGLLFAYPLLFCFAFVGLSKLLKNDFLKTAIFTLAIAFNLWNLERFVYKYSETNYPAVANYLESQKAKKLFTSVGLGITPFLSQEIAHENVFSIKEMEVKNPTESYFLLDDYWRIAQLGNFGKLEKISEGKWKEKSLQSPYLYLELCEFTGNSYEEAIEQWEKSEGDTYLRLIPTSLKGNFIPQIGE